MKIDEQKLYNLIDTLLAAADNTVKNTVGFHESKNKKEFEATTRLYKTKLKPILGKYIMVLFNQIDSLEEKEVKLREAVQFLKDF